MVFGNARIGSTNKGNNSKSVSIQGSTNSIKDSDNSIISGEGNKIEMNTNAAVASGINNLIKGAIKFVQSKQ